MALSAFLALLDNAWPVALVISAALAVLASSSLAIAVLILSLAASGQLSTGLLIVLVLGANLGGAVPPVLATLHAAPSARRVALGNLIVRAVGCLLALPLDGYSGHLLKLLPLSHDKLPVDAHLGFNLVLAALAAPFARPLSRLTARLLPDAAKAEDGPSFLEQGDLQTPVAALAGASREVLGVGDMFRASHSSGRTSFNPESNSRPSGSATMLSLMRTGHA